jgi:hypothetical protein
MQDKPTARRIEALRAAIDTVTATAGREVALEVEARAERLLITTASADCWII